MHTWQVDEASSGRRLDVFIAERLSELSRSSIQKLIEHKKVLVDNKVGKANHKLKIMQKVTVDFDIASLKKIPVIKLPILYEDDDCLVIDKPTGVLMHSKGSFNPEGTVATFIAPRLTQLEGERGGIVHRLDRATSGVMICAKNPLAMKWLQKQFSQRKVKKTYYAVVEGFLTPKEAIIDAAIERNPKKPKTFHAHTNGKTAITEYHVIKEGDDYSLVELLPQTGRTHQIRVHLAHIGHPIVGDTLYEGKDADRLYLHAHKLEITLPSKERKVFISKVPGSFSAIMK